MTNTNGDRRGLKLTVYRPAGAEAPPQAPPEITLIDQREKGIFQPTPDAPPYRIWIRIRESGRCFRADDRFITADLDGAEMFLAPADLSPHALASMVFGCAFAFSDSEAFKRLCPHAIPIYGHRAQRAARAGGGTNG